MKDLLKFRQLDVQIYSKNAMNHISQQYSFGTFLFTIFINLQTRKLHWTKEKSLILK